MPATQFNMKWVEQAGLVKFDFLGLKTLTVLVTAVELLKRRGIELDLSKLPLDDAKSYELLARGETVGVFQVEGQGMRRALTDMRPDRFEDIIALVALYRPGPMANIPTYCARKRGDEQPEYIHPKLEPILRETYGVIVYQEQVMQAAQVLAGLLARRSRSAAPRDGQEDPQGDAGAAHALHFRRDRTWRRARPGRRDFRTARTLRRLRLQQEPRSGLRAGRISDRISEGELPGRVPRGLDDARHGQHRQAVGIQGGSRTPWHRRRAAVGQSLRQRVSKCETERLFMRSRR